MCQDTRDARPSAVPTLSRRGMLRLSALSGAAALGAGFARPAAAQEDQEPITTPDQALAALACGNQRFVRGQATTHRRMPCPRDLPPTQTPFAAVLGCADSRVPVELLFDEGFGRLFVCRAAGNITSAELIGSLEYGVAALGAKVVMVLGHYDCGALISAMAGSAAPGQITALYARLYPAVARAGGNLNRAIDENVKEQVALLRGASTVLKEAERAGTIKVVGAAYDVCTGVVRMLEGPTPVCPA
ncbi:MAG TPA: carbonic anhydrase [Longimicrobium sp.]|nr:carbonic anhydrase [Longimicrobium sp.]